MAGFSKCLAAGGGGGPLLKEAIKRQGRKSFTGPNMAHSGSLARRFPEASMFLVAVSFLEVARG